MKYDTPILVSKAFNKSKQNNGNGSNINSQKTSASSTRSKEDPASKAEDYLNSILPPREY